MKIKMPWSEMTLAVCVILGLTHCGGEMISLAQKDLGDSQESWVEQREDAASEDSEALRREHMSLFESEDRLASVPLKALSDADAAFAALFPVGDDEKKGLDYVALKSLLGSRKQSADPICQGRWKYMAFDCFKEARGPVCGIESEEEEEEIVEYAGCRRREFGLEGHDPSSESSGEESSDEIYIERAQPGKNWCKDGGKELDTLEHRQAVEKACVEEREAATRARGIYDFKEICHIYKRAPDPKNKKKLNCTHKNNQSVIRWSGLRRWHSPVYVYRDSDKLCGRKEPVRKRKIKDRVYNACRHPDFGREAQNVCGSPELVQLSGPGLRRSELAADWLDSRHKIAESASCMTCDDLPYDNDDQVVAKLQCLNAQMLYASILKNDADRGDRFAQSVQPDALLDDIGARGAALFETVYTVRPVGFDFMPFYNPELIGIQAQTGAGVLRDEEKNAIANMCQALLQKHVDTRRIVAEYESCLSYPASVFSAAETQHEAKLRNEAVRMSMSLFARYVRAMQGGEKNGVSEIRNARHLAQLWFAHAGTHLSYLPPGRVDRINKLMHAYVDKRIEELENYYTP